ncbi:MAG: hypothetical protein AB7U48_05315, partial [Bauldia sp.]
ARAAAPRGPDSRGTIAILMNAGADAVDFVLPAVSGQRGWQALIDTAQPEVIAAVAAGATVPHEGRSMQVLRLDADPLQAVV